MCIVGIPPLAPCLQGESNSFYFNGPGAQQPKVLRLSAQPNSLAAFRTANGLSETPWQNALTVELPGGASWQAGEMRQFYL
jgi:hypothetical protein